MLKIGILDVMNLLKRNVNMFSKDILEVEEDTVIDVILTNIINKIRLTIFDLRLDCLILVNDNGTNKRAKSIYPEYKANRNKNKTFTEEEKEASVICYIVETLKTLPLPYIEVRNTEADTIIYHLIKRFNDKMNEEYKVYIISCDTDMYQMINDNVVCYNMYDKKEVNSKNWIDKILKVDDCEYTLNVKDYVLMKSIVGDTSDNIKGIKGIGWKKTINYFYIIRKYINDEFENHYELSKSIEKYILDNPLEDKKEEKLLTKFYITLNENENVLSRNMKLMDLSQLETSTLFEIVKTIDNIFNKEYVFEEDKFKEFMRFDRWYYNDPDIDHEIYSNHKKYLNNFNIYSKKINKTIKRLKEELV